MAENVERRLTAILVADVVGYSRLMGEDEVGTLSELTAHREELIDFKIAEHHGRIVKVMGDGLLVVFSSIVEAVQCAVQIQNGMIARNADVAENRRIQFRVGINVGDVIVEAGDIFGDGVNVAARLEGLAEPGGICISRSVHDQIRDKLDLTMDDLGEVEVKNIARPVRAWRWSPSNHQPRVAESELGTRTPSTSKPSIAVLPFRNMSQDPDNEYFSDGISEDVITLLSRNRWLYVIARNSSFTYRETSKDVRRIGCELGARYVVEGSVRKRQNRARVAVQLIDTHDGVHLWAERYDRELEDIFQVQDEIAQSIAATVEPELSVIEAQRAQRKPPDSLNAWDCYQRGVYGLYRFSEPDLKEAKSQFEKSIQFDPNFAAAHARLAYVYIQSYWYGPHKDRENNLDHAIGAARKAVDLDERDALGHLALGRAYALQRRYDVGISELREAIELNPGLAQAYFALGQALHFAGESEDAIPYLDRALRLSPYDSHAWTFLHIRAVALYKLGKLDEAEEAARASARQTNATHWAFATLASILGARGKKEEAAPITKELLRLKPDYSCQFAAQEFSHQKDVEFMARYLDGLREAGLPE